MLIESLKPLRVHLRRQAIELMPGQPMEFSEDDGQILLTKVPDVVRRIFVSQNSSLAHHGDSPMVDPPMPLDIIPAASVAKPIYWETGDGRILGPATPEFLAKSGKQFWIVTTFEGQIRWINADQLRSKNAFEGQRAIHEVELIRRG